MKFSVGKTVKVGVGRYETVDVHASMEADFTEETVKKHGTSFLYAGLWKTVDQQINLQLSELQDICKPDSVFLTKPKKKG